MLVVKNVVIGKPIIHPWYIFCEYQDEWKEIAKDVLHTNERYLPKIMKDLGMVKSISEVRRNRPELCRELNDLDYLEVKWGKHRLWILVGE